MSQTPPASPFIVGMRVGLHVLVKSGSTGEMQSFNIAPSRAPLLRKSVLHVEGLPRFFFPTNCGLLTLPPVSPNIPYLSPKHAVGDMQAPSCRPTLSPVQQCSLPDKRQESLRLPRLGFLFYSSTKFSHGQRLPFPPGTEMIHTIHAAVSLDSSLFLLPGKSLA